MRTQVRVMGIDAVATGRNINHLRKERKIRVADICEALGIGEQAIMKWQRGDTLPSLDNLCALSQVLGVRMDEIIVLVGQKKIGQEGDERGSSSSFWNAAQFFPFVLSDTPLPGA